MRTIQQEVSKIIPYKGNAKDHPEEQIKTIANSIKEFGFRMPILLDKDKVIIQGHGRVLAAKYLGLKKVPAIIATDLSPEKIKMLRLADNKVAESGWKDDVLNVELSDLEDDFNVSDFGFDFDSIDREEIDDQIKKENVKAYNRYHILLSVEYHDAPELKDRIMGAFGTLEVEINESSN